MGKASGAKLRRRLLLPALALLLAGPALSLPSLLVIRSVIGNKKTAVFTVLVVVMATIVGMGYGALS